VADRIRWESLPFASSNHSSIIHSCAVRRCLALPLIVERFAQGDNGSSRVTSGRCLAGAPCGRRRDPIKRVQPARDIDIGTTQLQLVAALASQMATSLRGGGIKCWCERRRSLRTRERLPNDPAFNCGHVSPGRRGAHDDRCLGAKRSRQRATTNSSKPASCNEFCGYSSQRLDTSI